jgi:hypothetical protein
VPTAAAVSNLKNYMSSDKDNNNMEGRHIFCATQVSPFYDYLGSIILSFYVTQRARRHKSYAGQQTREQGYTNKGILVNLVTNLRRWTDKATLETAA